MTHVKLMGELGEKFGTDWHMATSSFRDIFKLIDCQTEGFKQYILECNEKGLDFDILNGKDLLEDGYSVMLEKPEDIERLKKEISAEYKTLNGLVHSIAFANYSEGWKPFHETPRKDFLQSIDISCYSLIALSDALKSLLDKKASVVTVSISTTRMAAENYGYMAPAKAALDSTLCFLAKSFSAFSEIRFNSINPGLLKTSASAGIPGYVDSFLHAEKATLRKNSLTTQEAANAAIFLLSERSSGINAQGVILDAGMSINYFDQTLVKPQ